MKQIEYPLISYKNMKHLNQKHQIFMKTILRESLFLNIKKAFVCDLGLFHAKKNRSKKEFPHIVETVVCNELLARGYKVYAGKTKKAR